MELFNRSFAKEIQRRILKRAPESFVAASRELVAANHVPYITELSVALAIMYRPVSSPARQ